VPAKGWSRTCWRKHIALSLADALSDVAHPIYGKVKIITNSKEVGENLTLSWMPY